MTGFQADGVKGEIFVLCCLSLAMPVLAVQWEWIHRMKQLETLKSIKHNWSENSYSVHKMVPIPENNSLSTGPNPYISPKFAV